MCCVSYAGFLRAAVIAPPTPYVWTLTRVCLGQAGRVDLAATLPDAPSASVLADLLHVVSAGVT